MRGRRLVVVGSLLCVIAILFGCDEEDERADQTGISRDEQATAVVDDWPCEQEGYPCTWEEVSGEVTERGFALADQALERFEPGAASEVIRWLEAQPDVVDAGEEDPSLIWFRVEGGRPIMVQGPLPPGPLEAKLQGRSDGAGVLDPEVRLAGTGSVLRASWDLASSWVSGIRSEPDLTIGVTGRDRNEDARVNQRDQRKALILESMYWEACYERYAPEDPEEEARQRASIEDRCEREEYESVGERIEAILEESPAYKGNVKRLRNQEVDFDAIASWADYDVIHVDGHGSRNSLCIGTEIAWPGRGKLRGQAARRRGIHPTVFRAGKAGPKKSVWCVDHRFFRKLYPDGLERALIFINACSTLGHPDRPAPPLAGQLLGEQSMYIGWGGVTNRWYRVPPQFYEPLVEGWSGERALDNVGSLLAHTRASVSDLEWVGLSREEAEQAIEEAEDQMVDNGEVLGVRGDGMRIREVVKLLHPPGAMLGGRIQRRQEVQRDPDNPYMEPEVLAREEVWQQAVVEDGDDLGRLIVGALDDGEDEQLKVTVEVEAIKEEELGETEIRLELDGERIGESWSLQDAREVGDDVWQLDLVGPRVVEVGKDLEAGEEYELEAVVDLPEGGESRYAAELKSEECVVPSEGTWEGHLTGATLARRVLPDRDTLNLDSNEARYQGLKDALAGAKIGGTGFAKIQPRRGPADPTNSGRPLGEWYLLLDSRVKHGNDLDIGVYFPGDPEPGRSVTITDAGLLDLALSGGVEEPEDVNWRSGTVQLLFTGITESPGSNDMGVCGDIYAELTGHWLPPGATQEAEVPASFKGKFRAVWKTSRSTPNIDSLIKMIPEQ